MRSIQDILKKDRELNREVRGILASGNNLPIAKRKGISHNAVKKAMIGPKNELPLAEAMIRLHLRPALLIRNNKIEAPDSQEMRKRFLPYLPKIESRVPSVGRVDFLRLGKPFGGTGWMIADNIIATNRHVAELFGEKKGKSIVFRKNALGETVEAFIDFKEEYVGPNIATPEFEIPVERILFMTASGSPDIAFLKLGNHNKMPAPIPMSDAALKKDQFISVIGYPAEDPGGIISDSAAAKVFRNIYEVKRCSPGEVTEFHKNSWYFFHDCTTLGGNSGSVVLDNISGNAVGLHFMGEVEKENYAVKGSEVLKALKKIKTNVFIPAPEKKKKSGTAISAKKLEAPPASYSDRKGFETGFLGTGFKISLPTVVKNKTQVLKFKYEGKTMQELKYHHFSVVMNQKRRMCLFSACNIDGSLSKRGVKRSGWKYDSRIPKNMQIREECYGDPPKFSRGHMTRKEDPIWGSMALAKIAAADTFHVPNATPQMQPFNAPVWLALEDYALENARQDDMRISVITGPVFKNNDPVKYGVRIPVDFFKIIAFVHDGTGKLCATGYTVSQEDYLSNEEFVFGQFNTYQVAIKTIERKTGLKFGQLSSADPIKGQESFFSPLSTVEDAKFF